MEAPPNTAMQAQPSRDAREVFVIHGRNAAARDALFDFLRSIDLRPLEWSEALQATGKPSPYIKEVLDAVFSRAHAIVVLLTPDDEARLREALRSNSDPAHETVLSGQARPNVLFEMGMAMATSQYRTVLVELGNLRPFSDIAGLHVIRMNNGTPRRQELALRLRAAGCPVNLDGTAWHTSGDFDAALENSDQVTQDPPDAVVEETTESDSARLTVDAHELLLAAAGADQGLIQKMSLMHGTIVIAGNKTIDGRENPRTEARLQEALDELLAKGLIKLRMQNANDYSYAITNTGFQYVDITNEKDQANGQDDSP